MEAGEGGIGPGTWDFASLHLSVATGHRASYWQEMKGCGGESSRKECLLPSVSPPPQFLRPFRLPLPQGTTDKNRILCHPQIPVFL